VFVTPRYSEEEARVAVAASKSYAETLRRMSMCDKGGSWKILKKWVAIWGISTEHFDPNAGRVAVSRLRARPLEEVLVHGSTMGSSHLKGRLYTAGLKQRECELCGQGELWRGRRMSLILDHVNGDRTDNRIENLRIVCPNCNATLATHCGRNVSLHNRTCSGCGAVFNASYPEQRFCAQACFARHELKGRPQPETRRVERPPYEQLLAEVRELGWCGAGRKYGVSDNAIRKWVRAYEAERRAA
jgi:ribosomal protein S27AE